MPSESNDLPDPRGVGQRLLSFGAFWLSAVVLIGGGLAVFYQAEVQGPWEECGAWAWGKATGDTLGLFFTGVVCFLFVVTFWSFVFRQR